MKTFKFNTAAEAFVATAWIICTADGYGSMEERDFVFVHVQNHDIFKNLSPVEFQKLLGTTFIRLFPAYPQGEFSISEEDSAGLIDAIREVLAPELRIELWRIAVELACADGLCDEEKTLLEQLRHALEMDGQPYALTQQLG